MSRNTQYQFVPTDPEEVLSWMTAQYEEMTGVAAQPASPEYLFLCWIANIVIQERVLSNYIGNQNIPSRAEGENLDALAELFLERERPGAKAAGCTMRFSISEPQETAILIPAGTRVTDKDHKLVWETEENTWVEIGNCSTDVHIRCQSPGLAGNGYALGQINTLIDLYDYYSECGNITVSDGGADEATDEEFYELMRASMDGYSCAGSLGGYAYFAKRVSTEIADVVPNSPSPGVVYLYVLMKNGKPAGEEIKQAVLEACSGEEVRAFTDDVHMGDPESMPYDIDLTYYVQSNSTVPPGDVQAAVEQAAQEFIRWQSGKLGRDINPSKLYHLLMEAGIKRVDLRAPAFTALRDGRSAAAKTPESIAQTVPQVAKVGRVNLVNGGYEDE